MRPAVQLQLPPTRNASTPLAVAVVVASVVWRLAYDAGVTLYLVPGDVLRGHVWQLVTWLPSAMPATGSVLFSALILWTTGGSLEQRWGARRYLAFLGGVAFLAGLLTLALALPVSGLRQLAYFGGELLASAAWVGFGCSIWRGQTNIFGYPVTGRTFAMLGVLVTMLNAVFHGWHMVVAEFFALALTFAYALYDFPSGLWTRLRSRQLQRDLERRSAHLRVVSDDKRNVSGGSDKYLH